MLHTLFISLSSVHIIRKLPEREQAGLQVAVGEHESCVLRACKPATVRSMYLYPAQQQEYTKNGVVGSTTYNEIHVQYVRVYVLQITGTLDHFYYCSAGAAIQYCSK